MATLERPQPTETASGPLDNISELSASVPTPFPTQERASRSPSSSRLTGIMSKVKRSFSRDRTVGDSAVEENRGRSGNEGVLGSLSGFEERKAADHAMSAATDDARGRSSISFMPPLRATQTNTTMNTANTATTGGTSRAYSTGRGGAGNIRSPSRGRQLEAIQGEEGLELGAELPETVAKAREESASRSRSRGRVEVMASGRGGRGNIRSPSTGPEGAESRERARVLEVEEREVEEKRLKEGPGLFGVSSGRGESVLLWDTVVGTDEDAQAVVAISSRPRRSPRSRRTLEQHPPEPTRIPSRNSRFTIVPARLDFVSRFASCCGLAFSNDAASANAQNARSEHWGSEK